MSNAVKPITSIFIILLLLVQLAYGQQSKRVSEYTKHKLEKELPLLGLSIGNEVLIRTFKKEALLELWIRPKNQINFILFRTYPICHYSGQLGPKLKQGDKQTPEGFYSITNHSLNPRSQFHLSMNIGYPNKLDRKLGRTGTLIMIHGGCHSIGCFAMGDSQIEEIYFLTKQALKHSQKSVEVHAFPFHLSNKMLNQYKYHHWHGFWKKLKPSYDFFNRYKTILRTKTNK